MRKLSGGTTRDLPDAEWEVIVPLLPPERGRWARLAGGPEARTTSGAHWNYLAIATASWGWASIKVKDGRMLDSASELNTVRRACAVS